MARKEFDEAKKNKQDEFYTQLEDIEVELRNYRGFFENKVVFCNCDDPYESNFFKYFAANFNYLKLRKLIATCYDGSPVCGEQLSIFDILDDLDNIQPDKTAYKIIINEVEDYNGDGAVDLSDVEYLLRNEKNTLVKLNGNGDFRSEECIELLRECDVVVTNPPFSLFSEYVDQLIKYNKKFLIIGNQNAISYQDIFPLFIQNRMWLGLTMNGSNRFFRVPNDYPLTESTGKVINGIKYAFVKNVVWFTNLENNHRTEELTFYRDYDEGYYQHYDNYDAINVNVYNEIPSNYFGVMGVPITFLHHYNPSQFEIIGMAKSPLGNHLRTKIYDRQIQHKVGDDEISLVTKLNDGPAIKVDRPPTDIDDVYYTIDDDIYVSTYARLLIRRRQQ